MEQWFTVCVYITLLQFRVVIWLEQQSNLPPNQTTCWKHKCIYLICFPLSSILLSEFNSQIKNNLKQQFLYLSTTYCIFALNWKKLFFPTSLNNTLSKYTKYKYLLSADINNTCWYYCSSLPVYVQSTCWMMVWEEKWAFEIWNNPKLWRYGLIKTNLSTDDYGKKMSAQLRCCILLLGVSCHNQTSQSQGGLRVSYHGDNILKIGSLFLIERWLTALRQHWSSICLTHVSQDSGWAGFWFMWPDNIKHLEVAWIH